MTSRRDLIKAGAMVALAGAVSPSVTLADPVPEQHKHAAGNFWPEDARMVMSHMVGAAADLHPALAKEIVQRGHEATGHGQTWTAQFSMTPEEERVSYRQSIESIERATGTRPVGFNAFWLRGTPHTLEILQSLGFIYHIDDVSRDEPFLINVRSKPFAVVPYTLHMNDIVDFENRHFSTAMYADDLKVEFDALCRG